MAVESVPPERRKAASERLRQRSLERQRVEADQEQARLDDPPLAHRMADQMARRPWLGLGALFIAARLPGLIEAASRDGEQELDHRSLQFRIQDFLARRPGLCVALILGAAGLVTVGGLLLHDLAHGV